MADTPLPVSLAGLPGRWTLTDAGWVVSQEGTSDVVTHLTALDSQGVTSADVVALQAELLHRMLLELRAVRLGLSILTDTDLFNEAKGL